MDRRHFLAGSGVTVAAAAAGAVASSLVEEDRISVLRAAGSGVGAGRPVGLRSTTSTYAVATDQRLLAMSFDDGPCPAHTGRVLDILDRYDASATFFVVGSRALGHPDLLRRTAVRHEVANHSWSHPGLSSLPSSRVRAELDRTHDVLLRLTGQRPTPFRPPYGRFGGATVMAATALGYRIALWSHRVEVRQETAR